MAAVVVPAKAAAAVTLGSDLTKTLDFGSACVQPCTIVPETIPGRQTTAPFDGVITRWQIRKTTDWGTVELRVMRRVSTGPDTYIGAGTSDAEPTGPGADTLTFDTQLAIAAGDFIGVEASDQVQGAVDEPGVVTRYVQPPPPDGGPASPVGFSDDNEVFFNADVEPDVDCDGLGDETQDPLVDPGGCSGASQPPPAPAPLELELRAAKRKPLKRLNVKASCFDESCEAVIKGRVIVRDGGAGKMAADQKRASKRIFKLQTRRPSLQAGAIHKLGLRLKRPRKGRAVKRLIAAGARAKAKLKGEATAPDGRTATAKVAVRLTG